MNSVTEQILNSERENCHVREMSEVEVARHVRGTNSLRTAEASEDASLLKLTNYFEQVWVVNLKRRPDRLRQFKKEIRKADWPFRKPKVFNAIEGDKVGVPTFWQTGGGSYGCMRSHLAILERALQDDIESILVLEDDAVFMGTFRKDVTQFLSRVPDDWQCLMLGGQHLNSTPFQVSPGIVRAGPGGGIQRTHCYALRGYEIMNALYLTWANAAVHCDWVMGPCTAKFNTYAPDPFLVGQSAGSSDISGRNNPPKFWRSPSGKEPVIVLHAPRDVMEELQRRGWHGGFDRDRETGIDDGLRELFEETEEDPIERTNRLKQWINTIQWEVVSMAEPSVCTVWHPEITADMITPFVQGKVVEVTANSVEEALSLVPADIHIHSANSVRSEGPLPVVLLRAPRAVMEVLRDEGWHGGYWRDELTGYDNGIRRLLAATRDLEARRTGFAELIHVLSTEVRQRGKGVVTLWHEEITREMVETPNIQLFEIVAGNANEAKLQWKQFNNGRST